MDLGLTGETREMEPAFPIVRHPAPGTRMPVLVSVPHYGTDPLPHITRADYGEPRFETFAYGFADTFASDLYGDLHEHGATVLATPFSRMFEIIMMFGCTRSYPGGRNLAGRVSGASSPKYPVTRTWSSCDSLSQVTFDVTRISGMMRWLVWL